MKTHFIESLLARWLKKRGIDNYYSMTEEEKTTYQRLEEVLKGKALTDEDTKMFWEKEIREITDKLCSPELTEKQEWFLRVELRFANKIKDFLKTPEKNALDARMMVEQQIQ